METQMYRVASALLSVAGAILVHGSLAASDAAAFVAGGVGPKVVLGIGVVGLALVVAGVVGGSGLLRDFPGRRPPNEG